MSGVPTSIRFNTDPEVVSFVHQASLEFEPFVTPDTVIKVLAKDSKGVEKAFTQTGSYEDKDFRICIVLEDDGAKLEGEGQSTNIFEAISKAKDELLQKLNEIQDSVISASDRDQQIRHARKTENVH